MEVAILVLWVIQSCRTISTNLSWPWIAHNWHQNPVRKAISKDPGSADLTHGFVFVDQPLNPPCIPSALRSPLYLRPRWGYAMKPLFCVGRPRRTLRRC